MSKLVIVAGASGAGKSFLLDNVTSIDPSFVCIRKLTTRAARTSESESSGDLIFESSPNDIKKCDYRYFYATKNTTNMYGIRKKDIDEAIQDDCNPIVIVRSCETIKAIKDDYPDCLVIYLQSILSGKDLEHKLIELGRDDIDLDERIERIHKDLNDYLAHYRENLFDEVIINDYTQNGLVSQLQAVMHKNLRSKIKKGQIFVIMSFRKERDDYFNAIETACKCLTHANITPIRIDKKRGDYKITEKIVQYIEESELILCDLSDERPNVYWELGYARGVGKKIINIAEEGTLLHFDIHDFNTLFYNSSMKLKDDLIVELESYFSGESI